MKHVLMLNILNGAAKHSPQKNTALKITIIPIEMQTHNDFKPHEHLMEIS